MGAESHHRILGLLRVAAFAGAAAAFLAFAPGQARAADPLADATELITQASEPILETAAPVAGALESVRDPVVEATRPATDPVGDATRPVTDPVVEATKPVTDAIVDGVEPIVGPMPEIPARAPAPAARESPATGLGTSLRPPMTDAERSIPVATAAPRTATTHSPAPPTAADPTAGVGRVALGESTAIAATHPPTGSSAPLTNPGDVVLVGVVAAALVGIAAGWHRLSFERLRLPSGLLLAPPVPPG
jgi:hypothetical protein